MSRMAMEYAACSVISPTGIHDYMRPHMADAVALCIHVSCLAIPHTACLLLLVRRLCGRGACAAQRQPGRAGHHTAQGPLDQRLRPLRALLRRWVTTALAGGRQPCTIG